MASTWLKLSNVDFARPLQDCLPCHRWPAAPEAHSILAGQHGRILKRTPIQRAFRTEGLARHDHELNLAASQAL